MLSAQAKDGEEGEGEGGSPAPLTETVRCLAAAWRHASAATAATCGGALADTLALALDPGVPAARERAHTRAVVITCNASF